MLSSGNPLVNNNIINRHSQYNQEYMMNNQKNNNMNNLNQNMRNKNVRIGLDLNLNKNNNNNIKIGMNKQNNFMNNMNRNLNLKNNMNNTNNMNRNINKNNNNTSPDPISRALNLIRAEFRKKDDRIRSLQLKIEELEKQIELITNNEALNNVNNYNYNNNENNRILNNNYMKNPSNTTQKKIGRDFTFSEKNSNELHYNNNIGIQNNYDRTNKIKEMNYNNNYMRNNELNNRNKNYQSNSNNQYQINDKNQNNFTMEQQKYTENNDDAQRENSIKTWNSGNYQGFSKNDVKLYLKEVKSKLYSDSFREFIRNIKSLTSSKEEGNIDRSKIVEEVRKLISETDRELFEKFKKIIGYNE